MLRNIYKYFRGKLSPTQKSIISKLIFTYSNKPFVKKDTIPKSSKFPNGEKGGVIISADFELAWAWRYAKHYPDPYKISIEMAQQARRNFPVLLKQLEKFNISITWATVGHLFLNKCQNGDHDWMKRIKYFENRNWKFENGDWYDFDPYSDISINNNWYATDLVKSIISSKVKHEIATHTFSHIDFSDNNCPDEVANDEIIASIKAMKKFNLTPVSIVFPGGTWGNTKTLKKHGIKIYRKNTKYDLAYPYFDDNGLLVTISSAGFGKMHDWSADYYLTRYKKYIDKAISTGTIAHFWFHPSLDEWTLNNIFPEIFKYINKLNIQKILWVGTMKDIANYIINNKVM